MGESTLGRPRRRWVDNIRMDLQEVGCGYGDWIGLAQDRDGWRKLVNAVMNLRVPYNAGNFLTSCKPVSFSRRTLHHGVSKEVRPGSSLGIATGYGLDGPGDRIPLESGRGVALTPHPLLVPRSKNRVELYLYSP